MWSRLLLLVTLVVSAVWSISIGYAFCPERPPCHGCGCKGGPGYRSPDGHCVGFKELDKVCGNPPSRCVFENAPGTGENRECALAPRQPVKRHRTRSAARPMSPKHHHMPLSGGDRKRPQRRRCVLVLHAIDRHQHEAEFDKFVGAARVRYRVESKTWVPQLSSVALCRVVIF
jgi:hypothetical protein